MSHFSSPSICLKQMFNQIPIQLLRREITTRSMKHSYSSLQKSMFTVNLSKQWLVKIICGELTQNEVFHTGKTAIHILVETGENDSPTEIHLSVVFRADPKATHLEYTSTKIVINIGFFILFIFFFCTVPGMERASTKLVTILIFYIKHFENYKICHWWHV